MRDSRWDELSGWLAPIARSLIGTITTCDLKASLFLSWGLILPRECCLSHSWAVLAGHAGHDACLVRTMEKDACLNKDQSLT